VWDCKPDRKDDHINWVELKTSAEIQSEQGAIKFERKLLKFWAQSFLLGVPKIIVGFRTKDGILQEIQQLETKNIPTNVQKYGRRSWDGNICINLTASFLECMLSQ
jgi:RAT1-interacting protein